MTYSSGRTSRTSGMSGTRRRYGDRLLSRGARTLWPMSAIIATGYREVRAVQEEDSYLTRPCRLVAATAELFRASVARPPRLVRALPSPTPQPAKPGRP